MINNQQQQYIIKQPAETFYKDDPRGRKYEANYLTIATNFMFNIKDVNLVDQNGLNYNEYLKVITIVNDEFSGGTMQFRIEILSGTKPRKEFSILFSIGIESNEIIVKSKSPRKKRKMECEPIEVNPEDWVFLHKSFVYEEELQKKNQEIAKLRAEIDLLKRKFFN